jgi:hypothetical protein
MFLSPARPAKTFTSRMVREWKVFPYGRNIAAVVSAMMDKDRQGAAQKRQAVVRLHEARPKRQRGAAKAAAPSGGKPPLAAKSAVPASGKAPEAAAAAGGSKSAKAAPASSRAPEAAKAARELPPPGKRVADFATDISVDDYLVGKPLARFSFPFFYRLRWGCGLTCVLQAADFADRAASGALTAGVSAEVERLRTQHADAVREKSVADSKCRKLADKVAALEGEKTDLRHQLAEERREANEALAKAQAAQAEANLAWVEGSLARERAEQLEERLSAL